MLSSLKEIFHLLLNLDQYLELIIASYYWWTYLLIGILVFLEPGLFMPYLPGDTVIFIAATFAATNDLNYLLLWLTVFIFSILGDNLNYAIGYRFGHYLTHRKKRRFIKDDQVEKTRNFYRLYGGKTILFCRYIPVVRTFAPFMGGIGELPFKQYFYYDVLGVFLWSALYLNLGFFFGTIPWVQDNLALVIPIVVVCTMIPTLIVFLITRNHIKSE